MMRSARVLYPFGLLLLLRPQETAWGAAFCFSGYAFELEDYSFPPFCSGFTRTYAGTKDQLADFMDTLSESRMAESFQPLLDAYRAWLRGEPSGIAEYHWCTCWNIRPLDVYHYAEIDIPCFSMEHFNTWRCRYYFQADSVHAKVVYARDEEKWYRFVQASFRGLLYDSIPVKGFFMGHPAMLKPEGGVISNRLFFRERELGGKEDMLRDVASPAEIDFAGFIKDILGDG